MNEVEKSPEAHEMRVREGEMSSEAMIHELNEKLWKASDKICEECRSRRSSFGYLEKERDKEISYLEKNKIWKKEKVKVDFYCPPYLGFFHPENPDKNSYYRENVFFILESIGGGRPWKRKSNITFEEPMKEQEEYYLSKPIERFHQYCIREILGKMDERTIPFFVTDVVKCFVVKSDRKNFATAAEMCSTNFLLKQIFALKPKVIVVFGGDARDALKRFATNESKGKFAALHTENHSKKIDIELTDKEQHFETSLIYSIFPTANRNADAWVRMEAKENLLKAIYNARDIQPTS